MACFLQAFIAEVQDRGYAQNPVDHVHDFLSALLRTAVKWGYLTHNPAGGLDLPELRTVRPKPVLTQKQAKQLLEELDPLAKTPVGLDLLTGLSRAELFALRWQCLDESKQTLSITETVYEGEFGTPKTAARNRVIPLSSAAMKILDRWATRAKRTRPEDLIFSTRSGKPISPNNVLRRWVFPACKKLGLPRATWLTFRRTYASWAHDKGVPDKVLAALLGHSNVNTTLNVYTQVMTASLREAAHTVGEELFTIVHN